MGVFIKRDQERNICLGSNNSMNGDRGHHAGDDRDMLWRRSTYVECGDRASRVVGHELDVHVEAAIKISILGAESRAAGVVEAERERVGVGVAVHVEVAVLAPGDFDVIIQQCHYCCTICHC